ncbi:uncharacterized protein LOC124873533 isoform X1 [Scomber scombrus]|uniref:Uncharacterized protein LOC124873533 isoform X1 n=1 Tax=Scomber scombrus TaxID=13677 RepID=A0AAV1PYI4_SCOSC
MPSVKEPKSDFNQKNDYDKINGDLLNLQDLLSLDDVKPEITLLVNGKPIIFLCDTGACRTTCKEEIPQARSNGSFVMVRSASGKLTDVEESKPVWLRDPFGSSCHLSILMFPECPVNLLGRDGLLSLGLALVPTSEGRIAVKRKEELEKGDFYVLQGTGQPYYYYSLDVPNKPPHKTADALMTEGRNAISKPQDQMSKDIYTSPFGIKQHPVQTKSTSPNWLK